METIKFIKNKPQVHVGSRKYISPEEMLHLESDLNYTVIALRDGQKILSSTTLKKTEKRLIDFKNFVGVSKSAILNLDYVERHQENGFLLPNRLLAKVFY